MTQLTLNQDIINKFVNNHISLKVNGVDQAMSLNTVIPYDSDLEFVADAGYKFTDKCLKIRYEENYQYKYKYMVISDDYKTGTINTSFLKNSDILILYMSTVKDEQPIYLLTDSDIENLNLNKITLQINGEFENLITGIKLFGDDVLIFSAPYNKILTVDGVGFNYNDGLVLLAEQLTDRTSRINMRDLIGCEITNLFASCSEILGYSYTLTSDDVNNLENVELLIDDVITLPIVGLTLPNKSKISLNINNGDNFTEVYIVGVHSEDGYIKQYFTLNDDLTTAVIDMSKLKKVVYPSLFVNFVSELPEITPIYNLIKDDVLKLFINEITLLKNGVIIEPVDGLKFYSEDVLTFITTENRSFFYSDNVLSSGFKCFSKNGFYNDVESVLSDDKKTAVFHFDTVGDAQVINLICDTIQNIDDVVGTNNVYLIDNDILQSVNKNRFKESTSITNGVGSKVTNDYGTYILSVLSLPFALDSELILEQEHIRLADIKIDTLAHLISTDKITLNLGSISVPETNKNLLDYVGVTAVLNLPRIESIALDLEYIIGQTISINYVIDCYTGIATININSSLTNETIITKQVDLGIEIPNAISTSDNGDKLSNSSIKISGDNGIKTPFIEIFSTNSALNDSYFLANITDEGLIGSNVGYIEVVNVDLKCGANTNEKNEIVSLLNSGIFIK